MATEGVVLITGASSGFGRETAELLATHGYRVFGTSRRPQPDLQRRCEMVPLDVRDDASVAACVQSVLETAGRIDVLVNNAGFVLTSLAEEATIEQVKQQFDTNVFGVVRMTHAVLPAMRRQRSGRIITIGSLAGLVGVPGESYYSATKFALEGYCEALRVEVASLGIHVSLVEPGYFRTGLDAARMQGQRRIDDYEPIRSRVMSVFESGLRSGGDPRAVARLVLRIVQARRPGLRYPVGPNSRWIPWAKSLLPARLMEWGTRRYFGIR